MFITLHAYADDHSDINQLIEKLYKEKVNTISCSDTNGKFDKKLLSIAQSYFSIDFMKYYEIVCLRDSSVWRYDIRTSGVGLQYDPDDKSEFTNLKIGQPKITGNQATIRTTYDLPVASYKTYGNYTLFKLIKETGQWKIDDIELGGGPDKYKDYPRESVTGLVSYKSVKQFIKNIPVEFDGMAKLLSIHARSGGGDHRHDLVGLARHVVRGVPVADPG